MTASRRATDRRRIVRWPAILLLSAAIAVMVVVDADEPEPSVDAGSVPDSAVVSTVGSPEALSSTWYCASGTILEDGIADHTLIVANPGAGEAAIDLTVFPVLAPPSLEVDLDSVDDVTTTLALVPPEAVDLGAVSVALTVGPRTVEKIRVADLEGVAGEYAAVLVEANIGDLVVEHVVRGEAGASMTPCASTSADAWYFAGGTTRKGAREILSIFNPFPGDAVVDLSFTADAGVRAPQIYEGLVVPAGTVLPVEITGVVTLFDVVSARIGVRTGRVVAERLLVVDGSEGPGGLSVSPGSLSPAPVWVFPSSGPTGAVDAIAIHNPSTENEALVDVEVNLDLAAFNGRVEPIGLTIRPGRTEVVVLAAGAELVSTGRVVDASDRILDDVGYWAAVRSLNGVSVVADRITLAETPQPVAFSSSPGLPVAATGHVMTTGAGGGEVAVVNPAADRIAQLELRLITDGQEFQVLSAEVGPQERLVIDLGTIGIPADAILFVDSTDPVFIERRLVVVGGGSFTAGSIGVEGTSSTPELPLQ